LTGFEEYLSGRPWLDAILSAARLGFASMFVSSAIDKFRGDPKEVEMIASLHLPAPLGLERLQGARQALGAAMLVVGIGTRLAAMGLLAFTVFTTFAFLRYWSFQGPTEAKQPMKATFYANWAASAGLLHLTVFGPGRWAVGAGVLVRNRPEVLVCAAGLPSSAWGRAISPAHSNKASAYRRCSSSLN